MKTLSNTIQETQKIIAKRLDELLPDDSNTLTKAIRYSLLCKGKRLRPILVINTAKIFNNNLNTEDIITVASSIEMIHIFSLIHDDMPEMDNDDYRRGELTCHKKFTDYEALLAGDSLIPLAFETIISKTKNLTDSEKCKIILAISKAIGCKGMCLGQSLDVAFEKSNTLKTSENAENINIYKTGYLFKVCIEIGCILGKASTEDTNTLVDFAINFGKAFQLMDDLEDNEICENECEEVKQKIVQLVDNGNKSLDKLKNKNEEAVNILRLILQFCLKNN